MFLLDTNIWLEVLLEQGNEIPARNFIQNNLSNKLYISDFSLHSIGVLLLNYKRSEDYGKFIKDVIEECDVQTLSLSNNDLKELSAIQKKFNLDFDDAYQYAVAKRFNLQLVTFDKDFDKTDIDKVKPE